MMTNESLARKGFLFLSIAFFSVAGCSKDDDGSGTENNTVAGIVSRSGNFSTLNAAVTRADLGTMLSGTGPFTVFAPSNAAFSQLLTTLGATDINQIPVATLLSVLRYHVVPGRAFSSDLTNGSLTMLAGGNTTVNLTNGTNGGPTITGNGNGANRSAITVTNIVARNGVVHVIDRVLRP